jgi:haloalkane dehalogenase
VEKHFATVFDHHMAYCDTAPAGHATERTILLLHGNPTSSHLWRNVVPHLEGLGRCVVPDLIGMGDSDKLGDSGPGRYTFHEHRRFLDGLLVGLGLTAAGRIVLVVHDWGSALGFDWARRHPHAVDGIAYM